MQSELTLQKLISNWWTGPLYREREKNPQCRDKNGGKKRQGWGRESSWVGVILNLHTCMNLFAMQSQAKDLKEHHNVIGCSFGHLTHSLFTILNIYLFTWENNSLWRVSTHQFADFFVFVCVPEACAGHAIDKKLNNRSAGVKLRYLQHYKALVPQTLMKTYIY